MKFPPNPICEILVFGPGFTADRFRASFGASKFKPVSFAGVVVVRGLISKKNRKMNARRLTGFSP